MGKRARKKRRTEAAKPGPKPSGRTWSDGQQMARINVSPEVWTELRIEAMADKRSVADYLGHLVDKEVARLRRRGPRTTAAAKEEMPPGDPNWAPDWEE